MNYIYLLLFTLFTSFTINLKSIEKPPVTIVIFGATGDLAAKKLFPAIYNLSNEQQLNDQFAIVGVGRRNLDENDYHLSVQQNLQAYSRIKPSLENWDSFKKHLYYHKTDFADDNGYKQLATLLEHLDAQRGIKGNYLFYLATDASYFSIIIEKLFANGLIHDLNHESFSRVIIEKPFGIDLDSAKELQNQITQFLDEEQIYRMDHYLGKEGMERLVYLRKKHPCIDQVLNSNTVKSIQIALSETIGIGTRANFYEQTGHLRDVVQNHGMQFMALALMDLPNDAKDMNIAKTAFFKSIYPIALEHDIIRGQYGPGMINETPVIGYKEELGVSQDSQIETFVQAKLYIDNTRWSNIPIYLSSGKRLPRQTVEIIFNLKPNFFDIDSITYTVQPNNELFISHKQQQIKLEIEKSPKAHREGYENLILAAVEGDRSLYVDMGEVLTTWELFTPVLNHWKSDPNSICPVYPSGQWGPQEAYNQLIDDDINFNR